jgi:hypothetical protein
MNIYKKGNEILVSENGRPEGWILLGTDESITEKNKVYVSGYDKYENKAIFDIEKKDADLLRARQDLFSQASSYIEKVISEYQSTISYKGKNYHCSMKAYERIGIAYEHALRNSTALYPDINFDFDVLTHTDLQNMKNLIIDKVYMEGIRLYNIFSGKVNQIVSAPLETIREIDIKQGWA